MKVLIVGGAGYIGGVTTRLFEEAGHQAVVFDNLSKGFRENVDKSELVVGDVTDRAAVEKLFAGHKFDVVIHFAAKLDVGESMRQPRLYFDNNVSGSLNLIDAAAQAKTPFIFSSSATVYGEPEQVPIPESSPIAPINPYGFSKVMVEQLLASYQMTHQLPWLALRYFNPVGAYGGVGMNPTVSNLVPAALRAIKSGEPLDIFGDDYDTPDGTPVRDYVAVEDIARAHLLAAEKMIGGATFNRPMNLGSGQGYTVLEVLAAISKAAGRDVPQTVVGRRQGDAPRSVASSELAHQLLGWSTSISLDDMVKTAVEHAQIA